eukprot:42715-Prorocentrum_minimum.AAC.1
MATHFCSPVFRHSLSIVRSPFPCSKTCSFVKDSTRTFKTNTSTVLPRDLNNVLTLSLLPLLPPFRWAPNWLAKSAAEQEKLLRTYNATAQTLPTCGVHQLFEEQVAANPKAIALEFSELQQGITYEELNARANRLANHLRASGVAPGQLVGVFLERSPELLVALLAVLKAGAGYVPLDPLYPKDRITMMLEDSKATVVVTTSDIAPTLGLPAASPPRLLCVDDEAVAILSASASNPDVKVANPATQLMYVIFTSGSTGRPKGVQICHEAMVNFLLSFKVSPSFARPPECKTQQRPTAGPRDGYAAAPLAMTPLTLVSHPRTLPVSDTHTPAPHALHPTPAPAHPSCSHRAQYAGVARMTAESSMVVKEPLEAWIMKAVGVLPETLSSVG